MKYYVYEHWRTDTDLCFYVGKGSGPRAYSMTKRWTNHKAVQKYLSDNGFAIEVRMVQTGLEEPEALLLEAQRIHFWWKAGVPIVNLKPRARYSEATLKRMSDAAKRRGGFHPNCRTQHKLKLTGRKRKPFTVETIERMKVAARLRQQRKRERVE